MTTSPGALLSAAPRRLGAGFSYSSRVWLAACLLWLLAGAALLVDVPLSQWCGEHGLPGDVRRALSVGEQFGHGVFAGFVLLTVGVLDGDRRVLPRMICCVYLPGIAANLVKASIVRTRPITMDLSLESGVAGFLGPHEAAGMSGYAIQSFPSGHTASAVGLAIALSWRYPRGRGLFFGLAVMTAVQRIQCQAHFLSDTLAGAGLAVLIAGMLTRQGGGLFRSFESPIND